MNSVDACLKRELRTTVGTFSKGTVLPAVPSGDGGWLIRLSLSGERQRCRVIVVSNAVVSVPIGQRITLAAQQRREAAQVDYRFAREQLGYGHQAALLWLAKGYKVGSRGLRSWGFVDVPELERQAS